MVIQWLTQGQLAKLLPLQHIDPQSTDIIDHGAKPRRQLLDWLMFHVEPEFILLGNIILVH